MRLPPCSGWTPCVCFEYVCLWCCFIPVEIVFYVAQYSNRYQLPFLIYGHLCQRVCKDRAVSSCAVGIFGENKILKQNFVWKEFFVMSGFHCILISESGGIVASTCCGAPSTHMSMHCQRQPHSHSGNSWRYTDTSSWPGHLHGWWRWWFIACREIFSTALNPFCHHCMEQFRRWGIWHYKTANIPKTSRLYCMFCINQLYEASSFQLCKPVISTHSLFQWPRPIYKVTSTVEKHRW